MEIIRLYADVEVREVSIACELGFTTHDGVIDAGLFEECLENSVVPKI